MICEALTLGTLGGILWTLSAGAFPVEKGDAPTMKIEIIVAVAVVFFMIAFCATS